MNERDSEQVAHSLIARGYERVSCETDADIVLLNTCSVRDMAEQKALGKMGMLGRLAKSRPETVFGFLGCMAQARGAELLKEIPHLDLVVGTQKFHRVADYIDALLARKSSVALIADPGRSHRTPGAQKLPLNRHERPADDIARQPHSQPVCHTCSFNDSFGIGGFLRGQVAITSRDAVIS